jgi:hypothetical protein
MTAATTVEQVTNMLAFMLAQKGHPYSEDLSLRLGPHDYDCSGLVYEAAKHAGISIPQSDDVAASEADYLGSQPGVTVIKDAKDIKTGDVLFFSGAAPGPSKYGGIGHTGMAASNTTLISAYDTADGVTETPIAQDNFVVGMRLTGGTIGTPDGSPAPSQGGSLFSWAPDILNFFGEADKLVTSLMWLAKPASWVRIGAFLVGVGLLLFGIHALIAVGSGSPIISMPNVVPVPI